MLRLGTALALALTLAACAGTAGTGNRAASGTTDATSDGLGDQDPRAEQIYQRLKGDPDQRGPRR